jgi:hypothetical protein
MCFASTGLCSASEYDPRFRAPWCIALTRFLAPSALPSRRDPPLPGLHLPGSSCALALTMRLGALLPQRPPSYPFNEVRSRGSPFRACPGHSRDASRRPQSPLFAMATPSPFSMCLTCTVNGASSRGLEDGFASGVGLQPVGSRRAGFFVHILDGTWLSWVLPQPGHSPFVHRTSAVARQI